MALRRDDGCCVCDVAIAAGDRAQWDPAAEVVTCLTCADAAVAPSGVSVMPAEVATEDSSDYSVGPEPAAAVPAIDIGVPGASARKEHERRRAKHQKQIEDKWGTGRIGRVAKFLSDDPQTTKAWKQGAAGEERFAQILHERTGDDVVLLHDRKVPGTKGNIDHLAICASGVWIIDAKKYKGKVERRDVGGIFRTDLRLYVNGRDRTKAVGKLTWQREAIVTALGTEDVPIHCVLSFVGAEWPFFAKPFELDGVLITWPVKMAELLTQAGPVLPESVDRIARQLSEALPANR